MSAVQNRSDSVVQQEINGVSHDLDSSLRQQAETRSKLNLLEQLAADHEGFSGGSLAALKQTHLVIGSLADRIRVPSDLIAAVEAALDLYRNGARVTMLLPRTCAR